jgi:hypothetical protein
LLWEGQFAIVVNFAHSLWFQTPAGQGAVDLVHGGTQVFLTPFSPREHAPAKEEARDGTWRELREVAGGWRWKEVNEGTEGKALSRKFTIKPEIPCACSIDPTLCVACEAPVFAGEGPEGLWQACVEKG